MHHLSQRIALAKALNLSARCLDEGRVICDYLDLAGLGDDLLEVSVFLRKNAAELLELRSSRRLTPKRFSPSAGVVRLGSRWSSS